MSKTETPVAEAPPPAGVTCTVTMDAAHWRALLDVMVGLPGLLGHLKYLPALQAALLLINQVAPQIDADGKGGEDAVR